MTEITSTVLQVWAKWYNNFILPPTGDIGHQLLLEWQIKWPDLEVFANVPLVQCLKMAAVPSAVLLEDFQWFLQGREARIALS